MNARRPIVAALFVVALLFSGCASINRTADNARVTIQKVLDAMLPATFTGTAHVEHSNAYFNVTIDAGGLRRTEAGWQWSWLVYKRNGLISHGAIRFGNPPQVIP